MNMDDFAREARRFADADSIVYVNEKAQLKEVLTAAAELGEAIAAKRQKSQNIPYSEIKRLYNGICGGKMPKVLNLSDARRRSIKSRFADGYTAEDFQRMFETAAASPFLCGENERSWVANFDWLIKPANMVKVLEGNYSARSEENQPQNHSYDLDMFDSFALNNTPKL